jgi:hypothetical protein
MPAVEHRPQPDQERLAVDRWNIAGFEDRTFDEARYTRSGPM